MSTRWQHVTITAEAIEYDFRLNFDEKGGIRLTRGETKMDRGERSMQLSLKVPRSLWRTPQLSAKVEITDPGNPKAEIDVKATSAAIKEVTGRDIDIVVRQLEET